MKATNVKAGLIKSALAAASSVFLLVSGAAFAQNVALTAAATNAILPDGQSVPMWGYTCGAVSVNAKGATCSSLNPNPGSNWSPVVITVPYTGAGTSLTISLTNSLTFANGNNVPTSLMIVGQLGGGLGSDPRSLGQNRTDPSPIHAAQGATWPASAPPDTGGTTAGNATFNPPGQSSRVRSFGTEVAAGATTDLTWSNLKPGTYLIESGTHPSIQGPMGLYGVLVVTAAPVPGTSAGTAYPGVTYDAEVPLLLSEIDPVQNRAVATAVSTAGFSETKVWNGQAGQCGDLPPSATATAQANTCYPPAVNYDPRYYLINGTSFDRSSINATANTSPSLFQVSPPAVAGNKVLVRFVNAGLRMHVPSIIGAQTGSTASPAPGFSLIAEDGNLLPGTQKVQSQVFLAAGKTYDVLINAPSSGAPALPVFDRQLSLSTNNQRDGGMQGYIGVNGGKLPSSVATTVTATNKTYYCVSGVTLAVTDPAKGVLAGATGANGAVLGSQTLPNDGTSAGTLDFQSNGTFTYTPPLTGTCAASFTYLVNGMSATTGTVTIAQCDASTPGCAQLGGKPIAVADTYPASKVAVASQLKISPPGVLLNDTDPSGLPLSAVLDVCTAVSGYTCLNSSQVTLNSDGSFSANLPPAPGNYTFAYHAVNTQKRASDPVHVLITAPAKTGLQLTVQDAMDKTPINDYRWIIEEDRTFYIDPKCQINSTDPLVRPASCPPLPVQSLGYNFHTANMPVVATGCVGKVSCENGQTVLGTPAACDLGNGKCRTDADRKIEVTPDQVALDPTKRYYLSVLPGDGINPTLTGTGGPVQVNPNCDPNTTTCAMRQFTLADCTSFAPGTGDCGHAMGGASIAAGQTKATISLQRTPLPTAKIAVFVFEDDNPLNGENDAGGGVDVIAPNEPGLGGFEIKLFDQAGGLGDATGQITYDMFNMPVTNALAGKKDPMSGLDACPITTRGDSMVGMIPTCPKFESDGKTMSPLAGQALIDNLYPGLYEIVATPAADRIGRGEEWLQTNTLDGGKAHEAFIKPNEPGYFQEFGPGGFHVAIGFANPKIINDRRHNTAGTGICDPAPNGGGLTCTATLTGHVTSARMSRTPDQRIYSSGTYDAYSFTQCYVGLGAPDEADFAFAKCDGDGNFTMTNIPTGDFKLTVFDQWNDLMLDGLVSPVHVDGSTTSIEFPVTQWRTNLYTRTFIDLNGDGVSQDPGEPGLPLVSTNIRYRDGSFGFFNNTDLNGYAGFNEVFPFMNWLVVEADSTRYKTTGTHVVYDAGGPADGSSPGGTSCVGTECGNSTIAANIANTLEKVPLPPELRVPGARYCANADCPAGDAAGGSTGRVDPPSATTQGWQGLLGQNSFIEFGMKPYAPGENGGIKGHVIYASTRPFDDPSLLLQLSWEPGVPRATINLYQEGTALDGTKSLKLVDTTTTSSWDDWAQGFRTDGKPNMNCPGQDSTSPFFETLKGSTQYLNPNTALPNNAQFKCYDGWSQLNQIQPAPYDGMYKFPSVTSLDPKTGKPATTNCHLRTTAEPWGCVPNPDATDAFRLGTPMLPPGKYVVEVIVPQGFELVKEEDKNILLGDIYIAPVTQQFAGLGNIFILPDQAAMNATYNKNNTLNSTTDLGATPRHEGDTGSVESFWPCVGEKRIVPDFNSLFPTSGQNAPFAGALRPLCDRKEVTLGDQMSALAKFYVFTPTHIAGHFTGTITNDFASEFDPFSPQFGEKFGPPNLPVALRDFNGNEVSRVYSDQWGIYNGLYFSSYGVNPPNPTGYVPQMAIACMNDPGPIPDPAHPGQMITDPSYNPAYSNFCYETPFMPGFTAYMDTPVIPTQAFAEGYNLPDSEYPDGTPVISSVIGNDGVAGPWVSAAGKTLTITALGDKVVQNPAFSGPNTTTAPYNQKTITRHYGFGLQSNGSVSGTVTIGGVTAAVTSWSDTTITVTVPALTTAQSSCTLAQRGVSGQPANNYRCGQLVITAANGKQSIDAITVTVAGKTPTVVTPASPSSTAFGRNFPNPLQTAIDSASPGDLIIVGPGTYKENLIMWKPVRLQGVGAASVTINADAHPSGKMDPWRRQVNCLFGLTLDGVPNLNNSSYDPTGLYSCPKEMYLRADRIPYEGIVGWDSTTNGNLAQILQEPTLMGAYEGAGITVVGRGVRIPGNSIDFWGEPQQGGLGEGNFPDGSSYLTNSNQNCNSATTSSTARDYGTGNFQCNPSRIDGVSIINSSQGGGAIFIHGWNHNMEIANSRISANHGTLSGGINLGNGETPPVYINDTTLCNSGINPAPLCPPIQGTLPNAAIPYGLNKNVHIHHNAIVNNASLGDALFSGTPSGAGGITVSAGADNYQIDHNWISGNLSSGDGAGLLHSGLSFNGKIANNWVLFNQSVNPTLPTNGGGIAIVGAQSDRTLTTGPNAGQECGSTTDVDCPPGIGDGTGPGLVIDANLIVGNSAESGSGGGLRLQQVNGTEVAAFPTGPDPRGGRNPSPGWYDVTVTNNIIANNVAGWDGGGVSLQDALKVTLVNNTIVSNDTTASAGVLFKTLGAINSSAPPPGCTPTPDPTQPQNPNCLDPNAPHNPQPAGLVTMENTPNLEASLPSNVTCPAGFGYTNGNGSNSCKKISRPVLVNDLFWQNRAFHVDIVGPGSGLISQQNLVALTPLLNQSYTGECASGASFWDVGVRGDTSPIDHSGGATLTLTNSILTSTTGYPGNVQPSSSPVLAQYCNGSRVPPENGGKGYNAPAGRSETTGLSPVFVFNNITPAATVDEGHNWINLTYGPLTLGKPATVTNANAAEMMVASAAAGTAKGAYSIPPSGSPAMNAGTNTGAPDHDFFNNVRPRTNGNRVDIGAVEVVPVEVAVGSVTGGPLNFGNVTTGTTSAAQTLTLQNTGAATLTGITIAVTAPFSRTGGTCNTTLNAGSTCTINIVFSPTTASAANGTVTITSSVAVAGSPVVLTGTGVAAVVSATLTPTTWSPTANRGVGAGFLCIGGGPCQAFTLSNTGNVPLTGIAQGVLGGVSPADYTINRTLSTCGPAGGGQLLGLTTLAPGATCTVTVQFRPRAAPQPTGLKSATVSVTSAAGTKTSTLNGTAN